MSITQAQALAVLRDVIEEQGGVIDAEVLAWVARVADPDFISSWEHEYDDTWIRRAVGCIAVAVRPVGSRWAVDLYEPLWEHGDGLGGVGRYATREEAMRAADGLVRARGYWCDEVIP